MFIQITDSSKKKCFGYIDATSMVDRKEVVGCDSLISLTDDSLGNANELFLRGRVWTWMTALDAVAYRNTTQGGMFPSERKPFVIPFVINMDRLLCHYHINAHGLQWRRPVNYMSGTARIVGWYAHWKSVQV